MNGNIVRVNISLPEESIKRIKSVVPKRGVSKFLVEAAEEKIRRMKAEKAYKEILEAPPAFTFLKGKNAALKWVRSLRREDEKRLKRVWGGK